MRGGVDLAWGPGEKLGERCRGQATVEDSNDVRVRVRVGEATQSLGLKQIGWLPRGVRPQR